MIDERGPNEEGRETWSAYVPDLPGCVSGGETRAECEIMILDREGEPNTGGVSSELTRTTLECI